MIDRTPEYLGKNRRTRDKLTAGILSPHLLCCGRHGMMTDRTPGPGFSEVLPRRQHLAPLNNNGAFARLSVTPGVGTLLLALSMFVCWSVMAAQLWFKLTASQPAGSGTFLLRGPLFTDTCYNRHRVALVAHPITIPARTALGRWPEGNISLPDDIGGTELWS